MPKPNKNAEIFRNTGNNSSTTLDAKFDFDLDGCNISEVITFLQKLSRSPNASAMNMAFTKHITDALIKIKEDKLKHKAYIPRKLGDGWEPIINIKVNDFDLKALCDLGASVSIMPRNFMKCLICHHWKIVIWMSILMIMLKGNLWRVLMMFLLWLKIPFSPLISMFWMLNAILLVLLFWEDLFLELLVPLLI